MPDYTLSDCCNRADIEVYIFHQYRPKEFLVTCISCGRAITGKGLTKTATKTWNAEIQGNED